MRRAFTQWLRRITLLVLLLLFIILAVSNRATVTLSLFPLPFEKDMPLYALGLLTFTLGLISGYLLAGKRMLRLSRLLSHSRTRIEALEHEKGVNLTAPIQS